MIGFALLAAAVAQPAEPQRVPLVQQARATVKILAGARVTPTEIPADAQVTNAEVRREDGSRVTTRIVEFP